MKYKVLVDYGQKVIEEMTKRAPVVDGKFFVIECNKYISRSNKTIPISFPLIPKYGFCWRNGADLEDGTRQGCYMCDVCMVETVSNYIKKKGGE